MNLKNLLRLAAANGLLLVAAFAFAQQPKVIPVKFGAGQTSKTIKGQLSGRQDLDYVVTVGAGQTLSVTMKASNTGAFFNVLPPGSETAMVVGDLVENKTSRRAPIEGQYRIRVFLVRAAARRGESSNFTLNIGVTGQAIPALRGGSDTLVEGTPYHATATAEVEIDLFRDLKTCDAGVIRRGRDGTGTVVFTYKGQRRALLFVKGSLAAWDSTERAKSVTENGFIKVTVGEGQEHYRFAEELLTGG